jgi:hypothetical protein
MNQKHLDLEPLLGDLFQTKFSLGDSCLLKDGKPVTAIAQKRIVAYHEHVRYDAADIVYRLCYGYWPCKVLKFLDGNPKNLKPSNLVMADTFSDRAKMLEQHKHYVSNLTFKVAQVKCAKPPEAREGRTWLKYSEGHLSIRKAQGVWDDQTLRIEEAIKDPANYVCV